MPRIAIMIGSSRVSSPATAVSTFLFVEVGDLGEHRVDAPVASPTPIICVTIAVKTFVSFKAPRSSRALDALARHHDGVLAIALPPSGRDIEAVEDRYARA